MSNTSTFFTTLCLSLTPEINCGKCWFSRWLNLDICLNYNVLRQFFVFYCCNRTLLNHCSAHLQSGNVLGVLLSCRLMLQNDWWKSPKLNVWHQRTLRPFKNPNCWSAQPADPTDESNFGPSRAWRCWNLAWRPHHLGASPLVHNRSFQWGASADVLCWRAVRFDL